MSLEIPKRPEQPELTIFVLNSKAYKASFERVIHAGWNESALYPCAFEIDIPGGGNYKVTVTIERTEEPVS